MYSAFFYFSWTKNTSCVAKDLINIYLKRHKNTPYLEQQFYIKK